MRKFLTNILLFALPLAVMAFVYEYPMYVLGETMPIERVLERQEIGGLFMRKYLGQEFNTYKTMGLKKTQPKIVVVGSSRTMQFRSEYFTENFYNAGGLLQNHQDLAYFLNEEQTADFFIIGLDSWWYKKDNVETAKSWLGRGGEIVKGSQRFNALKRIADVFGDTRKKRIRENIGANAQLANGGFRRDGSMKVDDERIDLLVLENKFVDTESPPISKRIAEGLTSRFTISKIDTVAFQITIDKIKQFEEKGKKVLVYLPPFTNESVKTFAETGAQNAFYTFTMEYMAGQLSARNISFIPLEQPEDYGESDTFFMDGIHPSEVFVAMQLKRHADKFADKIDQEILDRMVSGRFCNLLFDKKEIR